MKLHVTWIALIVMSVVNGVYEVNLWLVFVQSVLITVLCDRYLPYNLNFNLKVFTKDNKKENTSFVAIEKIEE